MKINQATAGTLESGDIMINLSPADNEGISIELNSTVEYQFGKQIRSVIEETLHNLRLSKSYRQRCSRLHDKGTCHRSCHEGHGKRRVGIDCNP